MSHARSKTKSLGQTVENFVATFSLHYSWNLVRMFALVISWMNEKMGHIEWKKLGQWVKPFIHHTGYIFSPVKMFSFYYILNEFENWWCWVKTRSPGQIFCTLLEPHFGKVLLKVRHNVCLDISNDFGSGSCRVKSRWLGEIVEEPMLVTKGL